MILKLTLSRLERHIFAADIPRGKMDTAEYQEYLVGISFLLTGRVRVTT